MKKVITSETTYKNTIIIYLISMQRFYYFFSNKSKKGLDKMNIEKLEVTTYKNYKVICEVLGVEPKKGDSKKAQLKVFKQYFNWENQGQKWIITEIYETPQEKQDGRKDNTFVQRYEQPKMFADNQIENAHDKVVKKVETKRQEKKLFGKRPRSPEYVLLEEEQIGKAHNLVDCSHKHLSREEHKEAQKLLCYCKH